MTAARAEVSPKSGTLPMSEGGNRKKPPPGQKYNEEGEAVTYGHPAGEQVIRPDGTVEIIPLGTHRSFTDLYMCGKPGNN